MADHPAVSYTPSDEQVLIRSTARRFLEEEVALPRVRQLMMSDDGFERGLWKQMADLGWTGLAIAEDKGGAGLGVVELGVLLEEMGRMLTPGPFFASAVLATAVVNEVATEEEKDELLPALATGDTIATVALFEKPRGWDFAQPATVAEPRGGDWEISGHKRAVLDGHLADVLLVCAAGDHGLGLFAIPSDAPGVTVTQESVLDPTRRQATVRFERAVARSLAEGDITEAMDRALQIGVAALANEQVGGAQACLDMAVAYAKTRHQFGRPIGSYQAIKHRCAEMLMRVEQARSAAYHAVRVTHDPAESAVAAPLAGSVASEAFVWVAGENIQVHGGIGFTWEHDAHLYLKRAKAGSLLLGSPGHHRDQLGRALGI